MAGEGFIQADVNVGIGNIPDPSAFIQADAVIGIEAPGAHSPAWGPDIRLHVWLGLGRGNTLILDDDVYGRLNAGNVAAESAGIPPEPIDPLDPPGLWYDVSCDVVSVETQRGATVADGVFAKAEAATATIVLADPTRRFDPMDTTFERLAPDCAVLIWCEVLQLGTFILRRTIFTGRIDSIIEPWKADPGARRATIIASDLVADLANRQRPELFNVPEEYVHQRLARILDYYEGPALLPATSSVLLAATSFSGSAWDEIQHAVDAELGFAYITPYPASDPFAALLNPAALSGLRFLPRSTWDDESVPVLQIPCGIIIATTVSASNRQQRTRVTASRADGPVVTRYRSGRREMGYTRTDLALTDAGVPAWADAVLDAFDRPQAALTGVTLRPAAQPELWPDITAVDLLAERVVIDWQVSPSVEWGLPARVLEVTARVIGISHSITRARWEITWALADADLTVAE